jgi:predicted acetylornithine/succinylornithine family transaminase
VNTQEIIDLDKQYVAGTYARLPVAFVKGAGTKLWDADGKQYTDFIGGIGVAGIGHAHPAVAKAVCEQAGSLIHTSNLYYTENQAELAKKLIGISFPGTVFFANSGAEANEAAIKTARKRAKDKGNAGRDVISASRSFHGRTLATLAATGQAGKHEAFKPMPEGFVHVPFNDVDALASAVAAGACAVLLEPIQGEGGVHVASVEYMKAARELCDKADALLIMDEVQTGLARTGTMFAYEHFGVLPDILTIAKPLGGGLPIGAAIFGAKANGVLGFGDHGSTFGGSPLVCAAALAALKVIEDEKLADNAVTVGAYLNEKLVEIMDATGAVTEVRGLGLMVGAALRKPEAQAVVDGCLKRGYVINKTDDTNLRFLPPLPVTTEEIDGLADVLASVLEELNV